MNPRDRRALVIGGSVILAGVLLFRGTPWVVRGVSLLHERAAEAAQAASRARALLAASPAARDSLARLLAVVVALAPTLIESGTAAEAGGALSGHVTLLASQSSLRVVRIDPLPDSAGVFGRVAVRAELEGDVKGLARFLARVEQGEPVLTVPSLAISATSPIVAPTATEILRIEATIAGLFLRRPE